MTKQQFPTLAEKVDHFSQSYKRLALLPFPVICHEKREPGNFFNPINNSKWGILALEATQTHAHVELCTYVQYGRYIAPKRRGKELTRFSQGTLQSNKKKLKSIFPSNENEKVFSPLVCVRSRPTIDIGSKIRQRRPRSKNLAIIFNEKEKKTWWRSRDHFQWNYEEGSRLNLEMRRFV